MDSSFMNFIILDQFYVIIDFYTLDICLLKPIYNRDGGEGGLVAGGAAPGVLLHVHVLVTPL